MALEIMRLLNGQALVDVYADFKSVYDSEGRGLSLNEFTSTILTHCNVTGDPLLTITSLIDLFRQIDVNGDKSLEWDELISFLIEVGVAQTSSRSSKPPFTFHFDANFEDSLYRGRGITEIRYFNDISAIGVVESHSSIVRLFDPHFRLLHIIDTAEPFRSRSDFEENTHCITHTLLTTSGGMHSGSRLFVGLLSNHELVVFELGSSENTFVCVLPRLTKSYTPSRLLWHQKLQLLLVGCVSGVILAYDLTAKRVVSVTSAHSDMVLEMVAPPFTDKLFSSGIDGKLYLWTVSPPDFSPSSSSLSSSSTFGGGSLKLLSTLSTASCGILYRLLVVPGAGLLLGLTGKNRIVGWDLSSTMPTLKIEGPPSSSFVDMALLPKMRSTGSCSTSVGSSGPSAGVGASASAPLSLNSRDVLITLDARGVIRLYDLSGSVVGGCECILTSSLRPLAGQRLSCLAVVPPYARAWNQASSGGSADQSSLQQDSEALGSQQVLAAKRKIDSVGIFAQEAQDTPTISSEIGSVSANVKARPLQPERQLRKRPVGAHLSPAEQTLALYMENHIYEVGPAGDLLIGGSSIFRARSVGSSRLGPPSSLRYNPTLRSFVAAAERDVHYFGAQRNTLEAVFPNVPASAGPVVSHNPLVLMDSQQPATSSEEGKGAAGEKGRNSADSGNAPSHPYEIPKGLELLCQCFDDRQRKIFFGCSDGSVLVVNSANGVVMKKAHVHARAVTEIQYLPRSRNVVSASANGGLAVYDDTPASELRPIRAVACAHACEVSCLGVSEELDIIVTADRDGFLKVWDLGELRLLHASSEPHQSLVTSVVFFGVLPVFAVTDLEGLVRIFSASAALLPPSTASQHASAAAQLPESSRDDGKRVFSAGGFHLLFQFKSESREMVVLPRGQLPRQEIVGLRPQLHVTELQDLLEGVLFRQQHPPFAAPSSALPGAPTAAAPPVAPTSPTAVGALSTSFGAIAHGASAPISAAAGSAVGTSSISSPTVMSLTKRKLVTGGPPMGMGLATTQKALNPPTRTSSAGNAGQMNRKSTNRKISPSSIVNASNGGSSPSRGSVTSFHVNINVNVNVNVNVQHTSNPLESPQQRAQEVADGLEGDIHMLASPSAPPSPPSHPHLVGTSTSPRFAGSDFETRFSRNQPLPDLQLSPRHAQTPRVLGGQQGKLPSLTVEEDTERLKKLAGSSKLRRQSLVTNVIGQGRSLLEELTSTPEAPQVEASQSYIMNLMPSSSPQLKPFSSLSQDSVGKSEGASMPAATSAAAAAPSTVHAAGVSRRSRSTHDGSSSTAVPGPRRSSFSLAGGGSPLIVAAAAPEESDLLAVAASVVRQRRASVDLTRASPSFRAAAAPSISTTSQPLTSLQALGSFRLGPGASPSFVSGVKALNSAFPSGPPSVFTGTTAEEKNLSPRAFQAMHVVSPRAAGRVSRHSRNSRRDSDNTAAPSADQFLPSQTNTNSSSALNNVQLKDQSPTVGVAKESAEDFRGSLASPSLQLIHRTRPHRSAQQQKSVEAPLSVGSSFARSDVIRQYSSREVGSIPEREEEEGPRPQPKYAELLGPVRESAHARAERQKLQQVQRVFSFSNKKLAEMISEEPEFLDVLKGLAAGEKSSAERKSKKSRGKRRNKGTTQIDDNSTCDISFDSSLQDLKSKHGASSMGSGSSSSPMPPGHTVSSENGFSSYSYRAQATMADSSAFLDSSDGVGFVGLRSRGSSPASSSSSSFSTSSPSSVDSEISVELDTSGLSSTVRALLKRSSFAPAADGSSTLVPGQSFRRNSSFVLPQDAQRLQSKRTFRSFLDSSAGASLASTDPVILSTLDEEIPTDEAVPNVLNINNVNRLKKIKSVRINATGSADAPGIGRIDSLTKEAEAAVAMATGALPNPNASRAVRNAFVELVKKSMISRAPQEGDAQDSESHARLPAAPGVVTVAKTGGSKVLKRKMTHNNIPPVLTYSVSAATSSTDQPPPSITTSTGLHNSSFVERPQLTVGTSFISSSNGSELGSALGSQLESLPSSVGASVGEPGQRRGFMAQTSNFLPSTAPSLSVSTSDTEVKATLTTTVTANPTTTSSTVTLPPKKQERGRRPLDRTDSNLDENASDFIEQKNTQTRMRSESPSPVPDLQPFEDPDTTREYDKFIVYREVAISSAAGLVLTTARTNKNQLPSEAGYIYGVEQNIDRKTRNDAYLDAFLGYVPSDETPTASTTPRPFNSSMFSTPQGSEKNWHEPYSPDDPYSSPGWAAILALADESGRVRMLDLTRVFMLLQVKPIEAAHLPFNQPSFAPKRVALRQFPNAPAAEDVLSLLANIQMQSRVNLFSSDSVDPALALAESGGGAGAGAGGGVDASVLTLAERNFPSELDRLPQNRRFLELESSEGIGAFVTAKKYHRMAGRILRRASLSVGVDVPLGVMDKETLIDERKAWRKRNFLSQGSIQGSIQGSLQGSVHGFSAMEDEALMEHLRTKGEDVLIVQPDYSALNASFLTSAAMMHSSNDSVSAAGATAGVTQLHLSYNYNFNYARTYGPPSKHSFQPAPVVQGGNHHNNSNGHQAGVSTVHPHLSPTAAVSSSGTLYPQPSDVLEISVCRVSNSATSFVQLQLLEQRSTRNFTVLGPLEDSPTHNSVEAEAVAAVGNFVSSLKHGMTALPPSPVYMLSPAQQLQLSSEQTMLESSDSPYFLYSNNNNNINNSTSNSVSHPSRSAAAPLKQGAGLIPINGLSIYLDARPQLTQPSAIDGSTSVLTRLERLARALAEDLNCGAATLALEVQRRRLVDLRRTLNEAKTSDKEKSREIRKFLQQQQQQQQHLRSQTQSNGLSALSSFTDEENVQEEPSRGVQRARRQKHAHSQPQKSQDGLIRRVQVPGCEGMSSRRRELLLLRVTQLLWLLGAVPELDRRPDRAGGKQEQAPARVRRGSIVGGSMFARAASSSSAAQNADSNNNSTNNNITSSTAPVIVPRLPNSLLYLSMMRRALRGIFAVGLTVDGKGYLVDAPGGELLGLVGLSVPIGESPSAMEKLAGARHSIGAWQKGWMMASNVAESISASLKGSTMSSNGSSSSSTTNNSSSISTVGEDSSRDSSSTNSFNHSISLFLSSKLPTGVKKAMEVLRTDIRQRYGRAAAFSTAGRAPPSALASPQVLELIEEAETILLLAASPPLSRKRASGALSTHGQGTSFLVQAEKHAGSPAYSIAPLLHSQLLFCEEDEDEALTFSGRDLEELWRFEPLLGPDDAVATAEAQILLTQIIGSFQKQMGGVQSPSSLSGTANLLASRESNEARRLRREAQVLRAIGRLSVRAVNTNRVHVLLGALHTPGRAALLNLDGLGIGGAAVDVGSSETNEADSASQQLQRRRRSIVDAAAAQTTPEGVDLEIILRMRAEHQQEKQRADALSQKARLLQNKRATLLMQAHELLERQRAEREQLARRASVSEDGDDWLREEDDEAAKLMSDISALGAAAKAGSLLENEFQMPSAVAERQIKTTSALDRVRSLEKEVKDPEDGGMLSPSLVRFIVHDDFGAVFGDDTPTEVPAASATASASDSDAELEETLEGRQLNPAEAARALSVSAASLAPGMRAPAQFTHPSLTPAEAARVERMYRGIGGHRSRAVVTSLAPIGTSATRGSGSGVGGAVLEVAPRGDPHALVQSIMGDVDPAEAAERSLSLPAVAALNFAGVGVNSASVAALQSVAKRGARARDVREVVRRLQRRERRQFRKEIGLDSLHDEDEGSPVPAAVKLSEGNDISGKSVVETVTDGSTLPLDINSSESLFSNGPMDPVSIAQMSVDRLLAVGLERERIHSFSDIHNKGSTADPISQSFETAFDDFLGCLGALRDIMRHSGTAVSAPLSGLDTMSFLPSISGRGRLGARSLEHLQQFQLRQQKNSSVPPPGGVGDDSLPKNSSVSESEANEVERERAATCNVLATIEDSMSFLGQKDVEDLEDDPLGLGARANRLVAARKLSEMKSTSGKLISAVTVDSVADLIVSSPSKPPQNPQIPAETSQLAPEVQQLLQEVADKSTADAVHDRESHRRTAALLKVLRGTDATREISRTVEYAPQSRQSALSEAKNNGIQPLTTVAAVALALAHPASEALQARCSCVSFMGSGLFESFSRASAGGVPSMDGQTGGSVQNNNSNNNNNANIHSNSSSETPSVPKNVDVRTVLREMHNSSSSPANTKGSSNTPTNISHIPPPAQPSMSTPKKRQAKEVKATPSTGYTNLDTEKRLSSRKVIVEKDKSKRAMLPLRLFENFLEKEEMLKQQQATASLEAARTEAAAKVNAMTSAETRSMLASSPTVPRSPDKHSTIANRDRSPSETSPLAMKVPESSISTPTPTEQLADPSASALSETSHLNLKETDLVATSEMSEGVEVVVDSEVPDAEEPVEQEGQSESSTAERPSLSKAVVPSGTFQLVNSRDVTLARQNAVSIASEVASSPVRTSPVMHPTSSPSVPHVQKEFSETAEVSPKKHDHASKSKDSLKMTSPSDNYTNSNKKKSKETSVSAAKLDSKSLGGAFTQSFNKSESKSPQKQLDSHRRPSTSVAAHIPAPGSSVVERLDGFLQLLEENPIVEADKLADANVAPPPIERRRNSVIYVDLPGDLGTESVTPQKVASLVRSSLSSVARTDWVSPTARAQRMRSSVQRFKDHIRLSRMQDSVQGANTLYNAKGELEVNENGPIPSNSLSSAGGEVTSGSRSDADADPPQTPPVAGSASRLRGEAGMNVSNSTPGALRSPAESPVRNHYMPETFGPYSALDVIRARQLFHTLATSPAGDVPLRALASSFPVREFLRALGRLSDSGSSGASGPGSEAVLQALMRSLELTDECARVALIDFFKAVFPSVSSKTRNAMLHWSRRAAGEDAPSVVQSNSTAETSGLQQTELNPAASAEAAEAFEAMDADKDGFLAPQDLYAVLGESCIYSYDEIVTLVKQYGVQFKSPSGAISYKLPFEGYLKLLAESQSAKIAL